MYKAKRSGSTTSADGKIIRFSAGEYIDAKKKDLEHCNALEWERGVPVETETTAKPKAKKSSAKTEASE